MKTNYQLILLPTHIQQRARACGAKYDVDGMGMRAAHSEDTIEYVTINAGPLDTGQKPTEVIYWPENYPTLGNGVWAVMTSKGWIVIADLQLTSSRRQDAGDLAEWGNACDWARKNDGHKDANAILLMERQIAILIQVRDEEHESMKPYVTHIIMRIEFTAVWLWRKNVRKETG